MVDKSHALRRLGIDGITGHQIFLGLGIADQLRPDHAAAVAGDHADLHVGVADLGHRRHENGVAQQGDGCAQAHGMAVHGGDNRLLKI